jgi:hypothetical protein
MNHIIANIAPDIAAIAFVFAVTLPSKHNRPAPKDEPICGDLGGLT